MRWVRRIGSSWPAWLFLLSAAFSIWIAFDRSTAWARFLLVALAVAVYAAIAYVPDRIKIGRRSVSPLHAAFGVLPVVIVLLSLVASDWSSRIGKLAWLDPAVRWLDAWQSGLTETVIHPNVIGGALAMLIPLQLTALSGWRKSHPWLWAALLGLSLLALVVTESRGAWLALAMTGVLWASWKLVMRVATRRRASPRVAKTAWILAVAAICTATAAALVLTPLGERLLSLRSDREVVWRNSLDLISDYPLTGIGLGSFEMAYSSYVLLVHVGHTTHAHNLLLDVWLNLGILGLAAMAGLAGTAFRACPAQPWTPAAFASCGVVLLHGLVDDAYLGYGGAGVVLLLIPFALLARSADQPDGAPARATRFWPAAAAATAVLLFAVAVLAIPSLRARVLANLGAVAQTQAELSVYRWPDWPIQDALRQSSEVDLAPAIARYEEALTIEPSDATANRRLGQVEMARLQYDTACVHLVAAHAAALYQRATRQLLGECAAMRGDVQTAAELWRGIDLGNGQLDARRWWYAEYLHDPVRATQLHKAQAALGPN